MKTSVDLLVEIPCFKCLFWKSERESNLSCNPAECEELTEWLLEHVEAQEQTNVGLGFAAGEAEALSESATK